MSDDVRIIEGMPADQYFAEPGLSFSALEDLAVSPLRCWYHHINPNRKKEEPSRALIFGQALHAAVLEPDQFEQRFYCDLDIQAEYPEALDTMADLRDWLKRRVLSAKGNTKADLIKQILSIDPSVQIVDVLESAHEEANRGKIRLNREAWFRIGDAAQALREEPKMRELLAFPGKREVSVFVKDPKTGLLLKSRPDFLAQKFMADIKTITAPEGKTFDQAVIDAIWNRRYHQRAYFYSLVQSIADGNGKRSGPQHTREYILAFVESEPPHEVRLRSIRPLEAAMVAQLWERARIEVNGLLQLYADCTKRFGERPWRMSADVEPLVDEEFRQLAWA